MQSMSPIDSCARPVPAEFGRAMMASYTEHKAGAGHVLDPHATCHWTPTLVLANLLRKSAFVMDDLQGYLTKADLIGLASQRLPLDFSANSSSTGQRSTTIRAFLQRQVQSHLRFVVDVSPEDGILRTLTQSEPLYSSMVEEAMRKDLQRDKESSGSPGGPLLQRTWTANQNLESTGVTADKGDRGELTAAMLLIATKDSCPRPLAQHQTLTAPHALTFEV